MAFKTPSLLSEKIREKLPKESDERLNAILTYADENYVPVILPESAVLLKQLMIMIKPKSILEIGTAIGYSGIIMLDNSDCFLTTLELDDERASIAKKNFSNFGFSSRARIIVGDAAEILPELENEYDFIFLDGPKAQYIRYLPDILRILKNGGVFLADNVLYKHRDGEGKGNPSLKMRIDEFVENLFACKDLITSLLNVGDGMTLSIKKESYKTK